MPKFYTDNHKPPPLGHCPRDVIHPPKINTPTLGHSKHPPLLGHCLCDVFNIPKGLICSFLWPFFLLALPEFHPLWCPNFTHCLFGGGGQCPPAPPRLIRLWGDVPLPPPPAMAPMDAITSTINFQGESPCETLRPMRTPIDWGAR